jgi:DDE_Tnp_1-associated/Transposase DDE domain
MAEVPSLLEALATIPEVRRARGLRHPLGALLALACAAMLCGARTYEAIAEWGRNYDPELVRALGITHDPTPCAATFCLVLRRLDRAKVEAVLAAWSEAVLAALPAASPVTLPPTARLLEALPPEPLPLEAVAIDGKTLRGSRRQQAPGVHLLSALSQRLGLTLHQVSVDDKTNEIGAAAALLAGLVLEGRVFTMDALLTQREIAKTLVEAGAHYVMLVKENQPQLLADITLEFRSPPPRAIRPGPRLRRATTAMGATRSAC